MSSRPSEMAVNATLNGPIVRTADAANDVKTVANYIMGLRSVNQHIAIGWSWGTSIMSTYTSLNPTKVSKLVIYAPQWFRAPNAPPTTAYRTITRQAAYDRWVKDVPVDEIPTLLPGNTFDLWWNATVATDPLANAFNPPAVRAPNGIQYVTFTSISSDSFLTSQSSFSFVRLDNSFFWGNGSAPYDITQISCPTLVIRGDWDVDLPLSMAQNYYANLTNVPYKRFAQISEGTHTLLLEKNRMELFFEVQLFLDQEAAETKSTPFASGFNSASDSQTVLPRVNLNTTDYFVNSTIDGVRIFVRNKKQASMRLFSETTTVLMVHGATYPATTAFDLKLDSISWMDYLASVRTRKLLPFFPALQSWF
jgi:pimeloyl-ACP methyl ester carboxylesterase